MRVTTIERCDRLQLEVDIEQELRAAEDLGRVVTDVRVTPYVAPEAICYFASVHFEPACDEV
jgi:hypothetical protein